MKVLVGLCSGGTMKDPVLQISDKEIIEASTAEEAEAIYNKKNNCSYYYGSAIAFSDNGVLTVLDPHNFTFADKDLL